MIGDAKAAASSIPAEEALDSRFRHWRLRVPSSGIWHLDKHLARSDFKTASTHTYTYTYTYTYGSPSRGQPFILQPSGHRGQRPSTVAIADRAWAVLCSASNVANGDRPSLDKATRQQRTATPENVIGRNMSIRSAGEHEYQIIE